VPRTSADQHGVLQARVVALSEERIEGAASRVPHETTCDGRGLRRGRAPGHGNPMPCV
jgi:hypothetical protein